MKPLTIAGHRVKCCAHTKGDPGWADRIYDYRGHKFALCATCYRWATVMNFGDYGKYRGDSRMYDPRTHDYTDPMPFDEEYDGYACWGHDE